MEFKNFKEKQNYYKNLYKNRGNIFFAQPQPAKVYDKEVGKYISVKRIKGRTYIKNESEVK